MTSPETSLGPKPPLEIERKFRVNVAPETLRLDGLKREPIRQGYIVVGADGSETRVRDRAGIYTLTCKSAGGLSRTEYEIGLSKEQFDGLWPATDGKSVEKTRYSIPSGESIIELDVYGGALSGLVIAEMEFPDESAALAFEPPEWLEAEVTHNPAYKNQQLAINGLPEN